MVRLWVQQIMGAMHRVWGALVWGDGLHGGLLPVARCHWCAAPDICLQTPSPQVPSIRLCTHPHPNFAPGQGTTCTMGRGLGAPDLHQDQLPQGL